MVLILRALSYKGLPPGQDISAQFDVQGGSIGRAPNNLLVLPDPDKFISRVHANIVFADGQYFIEDSSTGGTFVNDSPVPLQQGRAPLSDGEKLRIGEYELLVTIADSATAGFAVEIPQPVRQLDLAANSVLDAPFAPAQPAPAAEPKADFFSSFIEQPESSSLHQSFSMPKVEETPGNSTVDDLDFDDLLSKLDQLPGASSPASSVQSPELPPLPADFFADEEAQAEPEMPFQPAEPVETEAESPFSVEVPEPFMPPEQAAPMPQVIEPTPDFPESLPDISPPVAPEMFKAPADVPAQSAPAPAPKSVAASTANMPADDILYREFLAGAGISDPNFLPPEQWPAMMRTSGELLRNMVQGLMQVLRARAELKSQFRVSVTTMRSIDNNPLKFTPNVDDAIKLILAPTNPGFLPPQQAVSEGFGDIMNHQIAMTAGIQAALAEILRSFDPQLIEKTQADGVLFQKKAKCWEYYLDKYPQLKAVAQDEFFGDAFADAYEKQMLLLSRAAKNP